MKSVSNDFKQAIVQPRIIDAKIIVGNDVITSDDINNISRQFNSGLFKTIAKMVEIDSNIPIEKDTIINPQFGLYVNGSFEYVTLDIYKVKDAPILNKDTNSYQITAYDKIIESMVSYVLTNEDITFPCTTKDLITAIYTKLGWDTSGIPNDFPNSTSIIEQDVYSNVNMTYRDVLDELCTLCCRWIIDINGIPTMTDTNLLSESEQVEGTSIDITDGEVEPIQELTLKGNTTQETTTGKNKLPNTQTTQTINSVKFTINDDKSVTIKGTASARTDLYFVGASSTYVDIGLQSGDYVLSGSTGGSSSTYGLFCVLNRSGSTTVHANYDGEMDISIQSGDTFRMFIRVANGAVVDTTIYPMLRLSNTTDDYEPYTGGNPAPSPTYPFDIHNVSGDNTIEICGKNLFNKTDYTTITTSTNGSATNVTKTTNSISFTSASSSAYSGIFIRKSDFDSYINNYNSENEYYISVDITTDVACSFRLGTNVVDIPIGTTRLSTLRTADNITFYVNRATANITLTNIMVSTSSDINYEQYKNILHEINLGKNLLDITTLTTQEVSGITITNNGDGSITLDGTCTANFVVRTDQFELPKGTYTLSANNDFTNSADGNYISLRKLNTTTNLSGTTTTFATLNSNNTFTNDTTQYVRFTIRITNNTTLNNVIIKPQLELGSQSTPFSKHFTPIELCKIGDYQDYIYKNSDKWFLHKEIGKVVLDGSENWSSTSSVASDTSRFYTTISTLINSGTSTDNTICVLADKLKGIGWYDMYSQDTTTKNAISNYNSTNNRHYLMVRLDNSYASTTDNFKTWLSNNNVSVYYVLATPTDTEITNEELIGQLESLMDKPLLRGINHITVSTSNEQPTLAITYINEIETINEEYMKDVNVEIQSKVFFNSLVFARANDSDNIYRKDDTSITNNGLHEFKISDMQTLSMNWRDNFIDEMWNYIKQFNYYAFDINTNGIVFLEPLDRFKLSIFGDEYKTSLINSDLAIGNGLNEKIYANEPQESETEYKYANTTDKKINQTTLIVDKQQGEIDALVSRVDGNDEKISQLTITSDSIQSNVSSMNENLTNQISTLQSSTSLQINAINQTLENGVEKLTNSLVKIDTNGINTSRSDETFNTQITNKTFEVKDGNKELAFMGYDSNLNKTISRIDELESRKATIGVHRCETITRNNQKRTAWFYVGGGN